MGPWHHGQEIDEGSSLGALKFHADTALYFRQNILRPFLDHYLKDAAPQSGVAPVTAYETGTNTWLKLPSWPAGCPSGMHDKTNAVLSDRQRQSGIYSSEARRQRIRRIRLRSRQTRAFSRPAEPADRIR